jgi:hypothetical protein
LEDRLVIRQARCELTADGRVLRDGEHVGTVRPEGRGWRYEALTALGPHRAGAAKTEGEALAHLGFRRKDREGADAE